MHLPCTVCVLQLAAVVAWTVTASEAPLPQYDMTYDEMTPFGCDGGNQLR